MIAPDVLPNPPRGECRGQFVAVSDVNGPRPVATRSIRSSGNVTGARYALSRREAVLRDSPRRCVAALPAVARSATGSAGARQFPSVDGTALRHQRPGLGWPPRGVDGGLPGIKRAADGGIVPGLAGGVNILVQPELRV